MRHTCLCKTGAVYRFGVFAPAKKLLVARIQYAWAPMASLVSTVSTEGDRSITVTADVQAALALPFVEQRLFSNMVVQGLLRMRVCMSKWIVDYYSKIERCHLQARFMEQLTIDSRATPVSQIPLAPSLNPKTAVVTRGRLLISASFNSGCAINASGLCR